MDVSVDTKVNQDSLIMVGVVLAVVIVLGILVAKIARR